LVLVKCENSQKIFGGYSPVGFYRKSSNYYIYSTDSFIFSFEKKDDTQNMKLSRVILADYAICNVRKYNLYGFSFGDRDLSMQNDNLHVSDGSHYECNLCCECSFTIKDIEVFRVIDKRLQNQNIIRLKNGNVKISPFVIVTT
jgi:hypothetical protein